MQIRKTKNGERYREEVRLKNGKRVSKTFSRKSDAKAWKNRIRLENEKNEALGVKPQETKRFLLKEYALQWLEQKIRVQCSPSTYSNYKSYLNKKILPFFENIYLDEVTRDHGEKLVLSLQEKGHSPKGVNIILGVLQTLLNEAVKKDLLVKSPLHGFKRLKLPLQKEIYWSKLEIDQFLRSTLTSVHYAIYVIALNTGMRRGELAGLCWDRVDFSRNVIEVTRVRDRYGLRDSTKSSKRRTIPLNTQAKIVLWQLFKKQINLKYVFCDSNGNEVDFHHLGRAFKKAQEKAGLDNVIHFHALRHTFASHFMMNGGNIYDLQKILGHSRLDMTERYSHLAPDHLERAIEIVSFGEDATNLPPQFEEESENVLLLNS